MGTQIDQYAEQIENNISEYVAVLSACSDEEWSRTCPNEERTVGVVAHHIATVQDGLAHLIEGVMNGTPVPMPDSEAAIEKMNAEHARSHANVTKRETIDLIRSSGDSYLAQLRSLEDADLDRSVGVLVGNEMTIDQVTRYAIIAHQGEHLASIRGALAQ